MATPARSLRAPTRVAALVLAAHLLAGPAAAAGGVRVDDVAHDAEARTLRCTVSWEDAWRDARNHDAAWLVVKMHRPGWPWWPHVALGEAGAVQVGAPHAGPDAEFVLPDDRVGVFVQPAAEHRGRVSWTIELALDPDSLQPAGGADDVEFAVHAVEMVLVPEGPFSVGDVDAEARAHAAFHRVGEDGEPAARFRITSEAAIPVGEQPGALHYELSERWAQYEGDRGGPVPAAFPKGFRAFYCMKYEMTQGQYAAFLNAISEPASGFRTPIGGREYAEHRGTIRLEDGRYVAGSPGRPMNWVSWDDSCAWADWMGLRPMTELEFAKACRGPGEPPARDYPWGTADKDDLLRVVGPDGDLVRDGAADESLLADQTRARLGASHWWILDLAGSTWERCVTIGHPEGRAFEGSHGDGRVPRYGWATNDDWPRGDVRGGGYGYRGGGWYSADHEYEPGGFTPHSPVSWRRYGSWGQAPRSKAYGFRAVRTAPQSASPSTPQ